MDRAGRWMNKEKCGKEGVGMSACGSNYDFRIVYRRRVAYTLAHEVRVSFRAGGEEHQKLFLSSRVYIDSRPKRRLSRMGRAYTTIRLELGT